MKQISIITYLLLCQFGFSQQVINGFSMPESIVSNGERFFVSNQGQDFISRDGDGYISEISASGKLVHPSFLPLEGELHAPKGMAIANRVLYVADLERIVGFDIETRQTVFELVIPEAKLLNDICELEPGFLGVTETVSGNIYQINLAQQSFARIGSLPAANGIAYNRRTKQLTVCTNGANYGDGAVYIKSENSDFEVLPNMAQGFFDGIEWMDDEHLLISDWVTFPVNGSGKMWVYNLKTKQANFSLTGESIADIYFDPHASTIFMPQMLHNRVLISDWKTLRHQQIGANRLYNYGVIDAFIGGLYQGTLPMKALKLKGDFGLGAPNMLDGELIILNGRAYQTKSTGETVELDNGHLTSFASVTFFQADTSFQQPSLATQNTVLQAIKEVIRSENKMYAVKISGRFDHIKTRAFPKVEQVPFPPLANLLDHQEFFEYKNIEGTLVGFLLPSFLSGINADGFHFHFLSKDTQKGGHMLAFSGKELHIEIAKLHAFEMETPNDRGFLDFEFKAVENEALRKVERGGDGQGQDLSGNRNQ